MGWVESYFGSLIHYACEFRFVVDGNLVVPIRDTESENDSIRER